MALMSGKAYKDSIGDLKINVYAFGKRIENQLEHELTAPAIEAVAMTYDQALDPDPVRAARITTVSPITGEKINRLTHVYQDADDLIKRFELQRDLARQNGMCVGARCVSGNIMSALHTATKAMQDETGTPYYERLVNYLAKVQKEDLSVAGCITDAKGDRSKRASEQADPDMYLRIVDQNRDGLVVRGAKLQISGATIAHELICMPTTAYQENESAYAVSFAIPSDTRGITFLHGRRPRISGVLSARIWIWVTLSMASAIWLISFLKMSSCPGTGSLWPVKPGTPIGWFPRPHPPSAV